MGVTGDAGIAAADKEIEIAAGIGLRDLFDIEALAASTCPFGTATIPAL